MLSEAYLRAIGILLSENAQRWYSAFRYTDYSVSVITNQYGSQRYGHVAIRFSNVATILANAAIYIILIGDTVLLYDTVSIKHKNLRS